jgi:hypothetical protein
MLSIQLQATMPAHPSRFHQAVPRSGLLHLQYTQQQLLWRQV